MKNLTQSSMHHRMMVMVPAIPLGTGIILVLLLLCSGISFGQNTVVPKPRPHGEINVQFTDMRTGQLIPGMVVKLHRDSMKVTYRKKINDTTHVTKMRFALDTLVATLKSNRNGMVVLEPVSPGKLSVRIEKPGYFGVYIPDVEITDGDSLFWNIALESCYERIDKTDTVYAGNLNRWYNDQLTKREEPMDLPEVDFSIHSGSPVELIALNDNDHWDEWKNLLKNQFGDFSNDWEIYPTRRYQVHIKNKDGIALRNIEVELLNQLNETIWRAQTDQSGKADLWDNFFKYPKASQHLTLKVNQGMDFHVISDPLEFDEGVNTIQLDRDADQNKDLDIAFVVDATASMNMKVKWFSAISEALLQQIEKENDDVNVRTAGVFYRDYNERFVTRNTSFHSKPKQTIRFLHDQSTAGGAEYAEALESGLLVATDELNWNPEAKEKIIVLFTDARGHETYESRILLHRAIASAATQGIRILPVACGNTDRETEFLLRTIALATNGTYTSLKGIHDQVDARLKPFSEHSQSEKLNELIWKIVHDSEEGSVMK